VPAWVCEEDHIIRVDVALVPNRGLVGSSGDSFRLSLAEQAAEHLHAQNEKQWREWVALAHVAPVHDWVSELTVQKNPRSLRMLAWRRSNGARPP